LQISASKKEVASILKHLDKDNKGYLDFRAFSTNVGANMSNKINVDKDELHLPNLVPSKDRIGHLANKTN
jgi:Ca2+-binding EF-hand superfamily protein